MKAGIPPGGTSAVVTAGAGCGAAVWATLAVAGNRKAARINNFLTNIPSSPK
jgi:hypothetical protein